MSSKKNKKSSKPKYNKKKLNSKESYPAPIVPDYMKKEKTKKEKTKKENTDTNTDTKTMSEDVEVLSSVSVEKKVKKKNLGRRFRVIVLPPNGGKTILTTILDKSDSLVKKDNIFVDIDAVLTPEDFEKSEEELFSIIKKYLLRTYVDYHDFQVVLVTSNPKLSKYLKTESNRVYTYYPTTHFFIRLLNNKGLITRNPYLGQSTWDNPLKVPKLLNKTDRKLSNRNYSLTVETGDSQDKVKLSDMSLEDMGMAYDKEMKLLATSRDNLANTKGSSPYDSFKDLLTHISRDLFKIRG